MHGQTSLLLLDYNASDRTVGFVDPYVRTLKIERVSGRLPISELLPALAGEHQHDREIIACRRGWPDRCDRREHDLSRTALMMLEPSGPQAGIAGISLLADQLQWWPDYWKGEPLSTNLRMGYLHVTGRGGPPKSREVYGDFVRGHSQLAGASELAEGFAACSREWAALGATFFRASISPGPALLRKISSKMEAIARLERELFERIATMMQVHDHEPVSRSTPLDHTK